MFKACNRRWGGYSLSELQGQRTMVNARIMIERHRLDTSVASLRNALTPGPGRKSIATRMLKALDVMDWLMLGLGLYRRLAPIFERHRKS